MLSQPFLMRETLKENLLLSLFFEEIGNYEIYISNFTIAEIGKTLDEDIKKKMNDKITEFTILKFSDEIEGLAEDII